MINLSLFWMLVWRGNCLLSIVVFLVPEVIIISASWGLSHASQFMYFGGLMRGKQSLNLSMLEYSFGLFFSIKEHWIPYEVLMVQ